MPSRSLSTYFYPTFTHTLAASAPGPPGRREVADLFTTRDRKQRASEWPAEQEAVQDGGADPVNAGELQSWTYLQTHTDTHRPSIFHLPQTELVSLRGRFLFPFFFFKEIPVL